MMLKDSCVISENLEVGGSVSSDLLQREEVSVCTTQKHTNSSNEMEAEPPTDPAVVYELRALLSTVRAV